MDEKTQNKIRCQSCAMPIGDDPANHGTEADGSPAADYCKFCYQGGSFTSPDMTVDGMVDSSIEFMTSNLGYSAEEATRMSNEYIRKLKRWN